jgi:hypothetical protein
MEADGAASQKELARLQKKRDREMAKVSESEIHLLETHTSLRIIETVKITVYIRYIRKQRRRD